MATTQTTLQRRTDEPTDCDEEWCDGPTGETLPCFACYDPEREYATRRAADAGSEDA